MVYRLEYFKDTDFIGSHPWSGTLEGTKEVAWNGMIAHDADFVRIIDVDGGGAEVWSTGEMRKGPRLRLRP